LKTKICQKCKERKPVESFNKNRAKKDGLQNYCRFCQRESDKNYYSNNPSRRKQIRIRARKEMDRLYGIVKEYLLSHPCVDCGNSDIRVLEFDHVRGIKTNCISIMLVNTVREEVLKKEIKKCEIRCANCHKIRHYKKQMFHKNIVG
jgi:hypothetical protein